MIASIFKWLTRISIVLLLAGVGALVYFREPILDGMKRMTSAADREARRVEKARRKAEKSAGAVEKAVERVKDSVTE